MFGSPYISEAIQLNENYLAALKDWYNWLGRSYGTGPTNAQKVTLYKTIIHLFDLRRPPGPWADNEDIASIEEMENAVGYNNDDSKIKRFEHALLKYRNRVEETAWELIHLLETQEIKDEFEVFSLDRQVEFAAKFIEGLSGSELGLSYLEHIVRENPLASGEIHILHPERFLAPEVTQAFNYVEGAENLPDSTETSIKRAGKFLTLYMKEMMPAMAKLPPEIFAPHILNFYAKYYGIIPAINQSISVALNEFALSRFQDGLKTTEEILGYIQEHHQNTPEFYQKYGAKGLPFLILITEGISLYFMVKKAQENPNFNTTFGAASVMVQFTKSLLTVTSIILGRRLGGEFAKMIGSRFLPITSLFAVVDVILTMIDTSESWRLNDQSVAVGQALKGVGIAASAVGGLGVAAAVAAGSNPIGWIILGIAGTVLAVTGESLATFTADDAFESWLDNNYFGLNWDNITPEEPPFTGNRTSSLLFKFRNPDSSPNIGRQVSAYYSMLYPLNVSASVEIDGRVHITLLHPILVPFYSEIAIKRLVNIGGEIDSDVDGNITNSQDQYELREIFQAVPLTVIYNQKLTQIEHNPEALYTPTTPAEGDNLRFWTKSFSFFEISNNTDENFNPEGEMLEIDIIPTPPMVAEVNNFKNTVFQEGISFTLRQRVIISRT